MLIVCEGRVTEIEYFQGIRDHFRSLSVEIHDCRVIGLGRDPASVVGHAIQERDKRSAKLAPSTIRTSPTTRSGVWSTSTTT
ncbi:RloB domain-containing protein [Streptosporangium lutulentum]